MHIGIIVVGFKIIIVLALQIWRALVHGISKMLQYFFLQIFANIIFIMFAAIITNIKKECM